MTMPIAAPQLAPPLPSRRRRWLLPVGVIVTVVGFCVLGAIALFSMVTLMSDPATPWVGLAPGLDGTPTVLVQRSGADAVSAISIEASRADQTVLWAIDRVPGSAWDGAAGLGTTPKGFVLRTAPGEVAIPAGSVVVVTNGCYASYVTMPVGPLTPGVVTTEGQEVSREEFSSNGSSFTPCGAAELRTPRRIAEGGVVLVVAGLVALVASVWRRTA